ncbi:hypothetical protein PR017_21300 (plasmid) [Rhizobium tumorigenes]|uniref:Uncharacterized protein n=1 Tax=Rhizobium tumorigenes TaxID=2041385 RepID=A0AAF1KDP0_9HYPH|nr:hypothetical protein [Rhizobium tumorigenes]WFR98161.1 hypothetical protein PR017_21300 [Rhizobium tumorigenes]
MTAVGYAKPHALDVPRRGIQAHEDHVDQEASFFRSLDDLDRMLAAESGFENEICLRGNQLVDARDRYPASLYPVCALPTLEASSSGFRPCSRNRQRDDTFHIGRIYRTRWDRQSRADRL